MNNILKEKSKKKLKYIVSTGSLLFDLMRNMDIKINKNGFHFLAFLKNVQLGNASISRN